MESPPGGPFHGEPPGGPPFKKVDKHVGSPSKLAIFNIKNTLCSGARTKSQFDKSKSKSKSNKDEEPV